MNLHEINEGLKLIENPEIGIRLMAQDNREAGDQAFREVNRLFHNLLASAKTLIEHTRIFMDKYYTGTSIHQAYSQKIRDDYANDELCRFIQDLRNYMLHQGLPHSEMSLSAQRDGYIETTISLDVEKLKLWSRWSPKSKQYLLKSGKKIKVSTITGEYGNKINALNEWLHTHLHKYHEHELDELKSMRDEYISKYGEA
ncbi:hypothetical protein SPV1_13167 [Mariprofundus ferrooxydans PV-1]|uniref:Uncharacterized protein n=2 Tax=Mariprofundus ferrooxydans TaxID=314344 RepID=Q0EXG6_9PROT|nr:hypothetical protein SPV1_13167 [Mariprofundus ferrooxydans PV-1]